MFPKKLYSPKTPKSFRLFNLKTTAREQYELTVHCLIMQSLYLSHFANVLP